MALVALLVGACSAPLANTPVTRPVGAPATAVPAPTDAPALPSKPAFVEFFSKLCAVCQQMAPTVSRLEDEYKGRVDFLMYDSAGLDEATRQRYRYLAVPQFVIVGPDGEIAVSRLGYQTYDTLKADIESVLAGQ